MHKWCTIAVSIIALIVLSASPAHAQPERTQALELFKQAKRDYQEGRFERAASLLREAYGLHPEPLLQYNLGRSLEALDDLAGAIAAYRLYLATGTQIKDRPALEKRIEVLEKRQREREKAAASKQRLVALEAELAEREPTPPRKPSVMPWVVAGAGAATVAGGGIVGYLAMRRRSEADNEPVQSLAADKERQAERLGRVSTGLLIGGGVVLAAGITWLVLDRRSVRRSREQATALRVGVAGPMAILELEF